VKYALDTTIFVDSFRSEKAEGELLAFLKRALPFTFLSAVVMRELAVGARSEQATRDLRRLLFEPFEKRSRVFVPSAAAFLESGSMIASLAGSCREQGITLITRDSDFDRFLPFLRGWRHIALWPVIPSRPA
jgi:predicted nucleic acid-binding protein